jgi:hypothetical protein
MTNRIDETVWEWLPAVGYGPLRFGLRRDALPADLGLRYDGDNADTSPAPDDRVEYYDLPDLDMLLAFDDRGLSTIHFFRNFRLNGREVIGSDVDVVKSYLVGLDWHQEWSDQPDQLGWVNFNEVGLRFFVDDGTVRGVIISRVPDK